jgi:cyclase
MVDSDVTHTMRVLHPHPSVYAFYDGRIEGARLFSPEPNWVDDGAYELGIAAYAVVDDGDALIYDTHITVAHARAMREFVESLGVSRLRVVLSHWHLDHIAGNAVFEDVEMISNSTTLAHMRANASAIEDGSASGPPPISPLVLPSTAFDDHLRLEVGRLRVDLLHLNIHSDDATVAHLADVGLLLAGDTLEDTVTYVDDPEAFDRHLADMDRLEALAVRRILPDHGDPGMIAAGGYGPEMIDATRRYVEDLRRCRADVALRTAGLREFIAPQLAAGSLIYFEPYEDVHRQNVERVLASHAP